MRAGATPALAGLLAALLATGVAVRGGPVPLRNPGFESAAADRRNPAGWALSEWTGGATDIIVGRVPGGRSGSYAARATWRSGGSNILLHQTVPFTGQHRCRLSFYFRTDGRAGVSSSIRALHNGSALQYNSSPKTEPATEWTRQVFEFSTHPDCAQLVLYLRQGPGTVWYDDVSLETIPAPEPVDWRSPAAVAAWEQFAPGTVCLNNFVVQLLDVTDLRPGGALRSSQTVAAPRDGWLHVSVTGTGPMDDDAVRIRIDDGPVRRLSRYHAGPSDTIETMVCVGAGAHTLHIDHGGRPVERLSVRSIPELICCEYESAASGREHLMRRHPHLLEDYNVTLENFYRHHQKDVSATERIDEASRARLSDWRARGRRGLTHSIIPGVKTGRRVPVDEVFEFWSSAAGSLQFDGIMCDEFGRETPAQLAAYVDAVTRLSRDPRFAGRTFYAYATPSWGAGAANRAFRETLFRHGHKQALEFYLREQPTEAAAKQVLADVLKQWIGSAHLDMPGSLANTIVVLCCCSKTYYGMNSFPDVDFRVFLDMQFHLMATDPVFEGLGGLSAWILRSADDETIRWLGRLHRHYAIEGHREMLSAQLGLTYRLAHLENPGFVDGLTGWQVDAAAPGSVQAREIKGFGVARGTMHPSPACDRVVSLVRTGSRPNRLRQILRHLRPGARYTLKMYSADASGFDGEESRNPRHAVTIDIDGADVLRDRYVREEYDRVYGGRTPTGSRTWFNYHRWTFRARAESARLVISDAAPAEGTAAAEQRLLLNFIEVQRVLDDQQTRRSQGR